MSLTLIKRPLGHKLNYTDITAEIIDDGQGDALVYTGSAHGLSDGDYVYIESNIDSYNGFKYVDQIAYDSFKIKNSENGDLIEWIQDADISYRTSVLNHGWQSVHLPIVYELQSDLWPNNVAEEAYVPNTIDSFENANGYTQLNLSTALDTPLSRNFIELLSPDPTFTVQGPYRIISVIQPWSVVINLAYNAAYDFTNYQVVNYYNNYAVNVEVWAGLSSDHRWAAKKPYELAGTLRFIPDSAGNVKFSVNEILRGYVNTRNNLTLDTLPNNLDFHVSFYIKYFESYDDSDGTEITTFEDTVVTDDFEGHAVNSMMPFKSLNSGFMSDYVREDTFLARWLTLFDVPTAVVDRFFDISFLLMHSGVDVTVTIYKSINNVVTDTEIILIPNPGLGVIRVPFIPQVGFDKYCLQAAITGDPGFTPDALPDFLTWTNIASGGPAWAAVGAAAEVDFNAVGLGQTSDLWATTYGFVLGRPYDFAYSFKSLNNAVFHILIMDVSNAVITDYAIPVSATTVNGTLSLTAPLNAAKIGVTVFQATSCGSPSGACIKSILEFTNDTPSEPSFDGPITEQICINIVQECETTFVNDNLRITEISQLRELE